MQITATQQHNLADSSPSTQNETFDFETWLARLHNYIGYESLRVVHNADFYNSLARGFCSFCDDKLLTNRMVIGLFANGVVLIGCL